MAKKFDTKNEKRIEKATTDNGRKKDGGSPSRQNRKSDVVEEEEVASRGEGIESRDEDVDVLVDDAERVRKRRRTNNYDSKTDAKKTVQRGNEGEHEAPDELSDSGIEVLNLLEFFGQFCIPF